jgi:hypothetical protein
MRCMAGIGSDDCKIQSLFYARKIAYSSRENTYALTDFRASYSLNIR